MTTFFSATQQELLKQDLNPKHIKKTQGNDYIEGWHAIAEANRIFGHGNWTRETIELTQIQIGTRKELGQGDKPGYYAAYLAQVKITISSEEVIHTGLFRTGTGAGEGYGPTLGGAVESAAKEAETDAMKRALITFGWPFGLALYQKEHEREHVNVPKPVYTDEQKRAMFEEKAAVYCDQLGTGVESDHKALVQILEPFEGRLDKVPIEQLKPVLAALKHAAQFAVLEPGDPALTAALDKPEVAV